MYKTHNKQRYKCILLKKTIPDDCMVSVVKANWFNKHKQDFYEYSKTCAIFEGIKTNDYLIIYENHL